MTSLKPNLRCTQDELPNLMSGWTWAGSQTRGWYAILHHGEQFFSVETSVISDDGIQICASVNGHAAHAPLVVILAVTMANGIDVRMVADMVAKGSAT